ncbi:hypothetical protein [Nonomuraea angiospora]|uniref:hypothetical protein n=1 Tax=Nonomuraea angiospora TaxID=46172 RepID=UPI0029A01914|nr:hypothetical protein [Nonomuraea angiospora]MDX3099567.1 hypothetical protein [Nonomuraea angiospora]
MNELQHLARVRDEDLAGRASGAGARALLAAITSEEPATAPAAEPARLRVSRWRARLAVGAVAVTGLAAAAVIAPAVLGARGPAFSYANSAIDIELRGDTYVATIKDPFADHARYTEGFKAVGLNVNLEVVPVSPTQVGQITGMRMSGPLADGQSIANGTTPEGCALGSEGCAMTVEVARGWTGWASVQLGRAARPGEKYRNWRSAMKKGEMLAGYRADGKTVGEVMAEVRRRDLKAVFQVITPVPGNGGYGVEPKRQSAEVGDDWMVWEVQSEEAGVVRLMVTKERLPKNPVYGDTKIVDE